MTPPNWLVARLSLGLLLALPSPGAGQQAVDRGALRDEAVALLSEYLRIRSVNPPGNELAAAQWLARVLAREGIDAVILDTADLGPGRANLYARFPGDGSQPAIALVHHMDVVPASPEHWSVDPFAGSVRDGYVWGRGVLDMKGHGVVQLMALLALKRSGVRLTRDVVFIANADEEVGGLGSRVFIGSHPDLLAGVEYVLTEGADTRVENGRVRWFGVDVGEKRVFWRKLTVQGAASHGSVPTAANPVPRLVRALARLAEWETPLRVTPAVDRFFRAQALYEAGDARRWLADAAAALRDSAGRAWLLSEPERNALLRNTVSLTVLSGSDKTNSIPSEASAELDIRLLPDQDTLAFLEDLERVIADPGITLSPIGDVPPQYDAPLDTELFRVIERVVGEMLPGIPVATPISPGATDRPYYAAAGLVVYGIDPYLVELEDNRRGIHGVDERLSVENVGFGVEFYVRLLRLIGSRQ